MAVTCNPPGNV